MDSAIMSAAQQISFFALIGFENKSFSLLWRGSRDGFDAAAFHRLCDGKANTVTVIKNTNGFIFGGFTSNPWSSLDIGYQKDSTAFLFSLTNVVNTPLKLKIKSSGNYAVLQSSFSGPIFGSVHDLMVCSLSDTNRKSFMNIQSYEYPCGISGYEGGQFIVGGSDHYFQTVEIEVFQVL
jgi:hypothetical protein